MTQLLVYIAHMPFMCHSLLLGRFTRKINKRAGTLKYIKKIKGALMKVSLVECAVFRYPKGLEDWRAYRIEYGGHAENCVVEGFIWLPKNLDAEMIEKLLEEAQDENIR